jgi:hypothetical protein
MGDASPFKTSKFKELFKPMGFDPYDRSLKIWESFKTLTPQVGVALKV